MRVKVDFYSINKVSVQAELLVQAMMTEAVRKSFF